MSVTDPKTTYAFVDDQSPRITYNGPWFNEIGVDGAWNDTLSFANSSGSSATFKFNGESCSCPTDGSHSCRSFEL